MMAQKAALFGDMDTRDRILATTDPHETKSLGRQAKNFNQELWLANRASIVQAGNFAKFSSPTNIHLKQLLLATDDRVLVDATATDKIWGIGLATTDNDVTHPEKWPGLNLLGEALMAVRRRLSS
ncbi:hypothetical protein DYB32_006425 [Aphanomyces invadans]|uniref:NADAR domain-containing protein n=1 Tax=Aphanomyces invadans TaxID=157072 RepID=A0A3R6WJJ6_9STRA|nr:hypothetical protein DYB32_006425 [Aphanomyces invadans]